MNSKTYPMHIVDPNAEYRGVSVTKLMDRAGKEALKAIEKKWKLKGKKIQIFCGGGNNGGDGFALAAELLKLNPRDFSGEVEVILAVPKNKIRTPAARHHFKRIASLTHHLGGGLISQYSDKTTFDGDILVDALLGIGVQGKLKEPFAEIVKKISKVKSQKSSADSGACPPESSDEGWVVKDPPEPKLVSLDIPTGNLKPDLVIAFHSSKMEVACPERSRLGGRVERVVPIGIPKIAETHFGPGDVRVNFPRRAANSHKGENGKVIIIGGSREFVGAPIFAGLGAISSGADLVYVWVPEINFAAVRRASPNFLVKSFSGNPEKLTPDAVKEILSFAQKEKASIVLGCGLGKDLETQEAILEIARKTKQPLVLDADALLPELTKSAKHLNSPLSQRGVGGDSTRKTVLTPHTRELKRLGGNAKNIAKKLNVVVLQKGKTDAIHSPTQTRYNDAGHPVATVGGSGDVLAGLIGGLLARGIEPFEAAGISSFLLGIASEKCAVKSESITPQMLAKKIPMIVQSIISKKF